MAILTRKDFTDSLIEKLAYKMQEDINGSKRKNIKLEEWLSQNIELLEPIIYHNRHCLGYRDEEKYDAILDLIEENNLLDF